MENTKVYCKLQLLTESTELNPCEAIIALAQILKDRQPRLAKNPKLCYILSKCPLQDERRRGI
jgi:hypothetical protein